MGIVPAETVVAVVGATATGKSDLAVDLALALRSSAGGAPGGGGEVVNADASQLYAGMDVGTAKLPPGQRLGVPHHLLDVLRVTQDASVARYQREARAALADITARGGVPVLVGGSGLYVRAAIDALDFPPTDPVVRAALEAEAEALGPAVLHTRLAAVDPAAALAILPGNVRRVVRALEVHAITGRPFSATLPRQRVYAVPAVQIGLRSDRAALVESIGARVAAMVDHGLVEEVRALVGLGLREGTTARRALGYAQVLDHLDGRTTLAEAVAATTAGTRAYAKRQVSWFRADPRVHWVDVDGTTRAQRAERALALVRAAVASAQGPGSWSASPAPPPAPDLGSPG